MIVRAVARLVAAIAAAAAIAVLAGCALLAGCSGGGARPARTAGQERPAVAGGRHSGLGAVMAGLTSRGGAAFYLSLGDSLALGIQPEPSGRDVPTSDGYADQLAARLRGAIPMLKLVKLGCSGETTATMIHGAICRYPAGSQLAQATSFLRAHRGQVALITIDIGANDPNSCVLGARPATIAHCLSGRVRQTERNLGAILARLRAAAGHDVLIVGMTYYVPELGLWPRSRNGMEIAAVTDEFAASVNKMLAGQYHRHGARVAGVFAAFRSADFSAPKSPAGSGQPSPRATPVNVTRICALTWMCAGPPRGPNEHANTAGYRLIARAFWRAVTS